jgi:hypothetical protein
MDYTNLDNLNNLMNELEEDNKNHEEIKQTKKTSPDIVNQKNEMNSKLFMRDLDFRTSINKNSIVSKNVSFLDEKLDEENKPNFNKQLNSRIFDLNKEVKMPPIMDFYPKSSSSFTKTKDSSN